jgi:hypothetical protein
LPAPPEIGGLFRWGYANGAHSDMFIHGIANNQYLNTMFIDKAVNGWVAAENALATEVITNWGFKVKDPPGAAKAFHQPNGETVLRVRSHRVGRPFGLYRGRFAA